MSISKEERERILPVLDMDLVNEPEPGTDAAEVMSFCREHIRRLLADANETDERIAELEAENRRLKQTLASIIVSNDPPTQADIDRAHELVERGGDRGLMTLTAILWTVTVIGVAAALADDKPKNWSSQLLTFIAAACLLWVAGVLCWIVVGRVMEVMG